jgi:hypothetical protein
MKSPQQRHDELSMLPDEPQAPLKPLMLVEEPTYEGLTKLMAVGQPSVGLFTDEGGRMIGGYSMSAEHQFKTASGLSNPWDGKPVDRVRAGDSAYKLYNRRLSIHLMMQPIVAETLLNNHVLAGQGLISRCLLAWPASTAGTRAYTSVDLFDDEAMKAYVSRMQGLLETPLPCLEGKQNELYPRDLTLTDDAKVLWIQYHDRIESLLKEGQALAPRRGFANKAAEHLLRVADVLTAFEDLEALNISVDKVKAAAELMDYYLNEALRLHEAAAVHPDITLAEKLLAWAQRYQHIYLKQIYQYGPSAIREKAVAKRITDILVGHGWLIRVEGGIIIDDALRRDAWEVVHEVS